VTARRVVYLLPDPGVPVDGTKGASVHVAEVCRALAARGAEVTLVAQRCARGGDPVDRVRGAFQLVLLDPGPLPRGPGGDPARIAAADDFAARAAEVLADRNPDLVYERLALFFGWGRSLAAAVGAARLVEVNAPVAAERRRSIGLLATDVADRAERAALVGAKVLAVSEPLAAWAQGRGAATVEVVPNGVDGPRFAAPGQRAAARVIRRNLGLLDAEVVGFIGSLKPWHGVEILLEAAAELAIGRPRLRVLVVGEGPGRLELERHATIGPLAGRVIFTGAVAPERVPAHLAALDIAVAPYRPGPDFYFSPLKVVEAMAAGRPVVASRFAPIERMLSGAGVLVTPGDPGELARALARLLDDPDEADRLGRRAARRARRAHGWDRVAARILASAEPVRGDHSTVPE